MAHTIKIMHEVGEVTGVGGVGAELPGHDAWLDRAATDMLRILPRLIRSIKHQARNAESDGPMHELGGSQMMALFSLLEGRKMTSTLSRNFNVTSPTMSRIVDGLVDKGYVERQPDPGDRRCIYLQLTPHGKALGLEALEQSRRALMQYLSPLSEEQLSELVRVFGYIQRLLPDSGQEQIGCPVASIESSKT